MAQPSTTAATANSHESVSFGSGTFAGRTGNLMRDVKSQFPPLRK